MPQTGLDIPGRESSVLYYQTSGIYQKSRIRVEPGSPQRKDTKSQSRLRQDFLAHVTSYGSQLGWFGCGSGWKTPKFLSVCSQNCVWVGSVKFVELHKGELFVLANVQTSRQTKTETERKSELFHQQWD